MDIAGVIIEILKSILPSVMVFLAVYFVMKGFFDNEEKRRMLETRMESKNQVTPMRLQAYERLALLLERISPHSLVVRSNKPGMSAQELKTTLINSIHEEFNHNLSQQIYVSPQAWSLVKVVKEEIVNLVNTSYANLGDKKTGLDLSKVIFERLIQQEQVPTDKALTFLKKEIQIIFS